MYLNKIKQNKESTSGSKTVRNSNVIKEPKDEINEAHLRLKRTLRMYEDLVDEFDLRGDEKTSQENSSKKKAPLNEPKVNFIEIDFTNEATPETNSKSEINLLDLDIQPTSTKPEVSKEAEIPQPSNDDFFSNDLICYDSKLPSKKAEEEDFFSMIANRPITHQADQAHN
jgi:hypothetical protein